MCPDHTWWREPSVLEAEFFATFSRTLSVIPYLTFRVMASMSMWFPFTFVSRPFDTGGNDDDCRLRWFRATYYGRHRRNHISRVFAELFFGTGRIWVILTSSLNFMHDKGLGDKRHDKKCIVNPCCQATSWYLSLLWQFGCEIKGIFDSSCPDNSTSINELRLHLGSQVNTMSGHKRGLVTPIVWTFHRMTSRLRSVYGSWPCL